MKILLILALMCLARLAVCNTVTVNVKDDANKPVGDVNVAIWFCSPVEKPSDKQVFKSDSSGCVTAHGETVVGYYIVVDKEHYYSVKSEPYIGPRKTVERTYVLRGICTPIALFSKVVRGLNFPMHNEWLGYDFECGDWVAPYGKGKIADIRFKLRNEFLGWKLSDQEMADIRRIKDITADEIRFFYGKWTAELDVSFPGEKEGLIEVKEQYLLYSRLRLPHQAPEMGYLASRHYEANNLGMHPLKEEMGFFLRTRVKLDEKGQIVSANYAKFYGDISLDPRGSISFTYYFNPVPNDRNLEFDPRKNLFPETMPGADVSDP